MPVAFLSLRKNIHNSLARLAAPRLAGVWRTIGIALWLAVFFMSLLAWGLGVYAGWLWDTTPADQINQLPTTHVPLTPAEIQARAEYRQAIFEVGLSLPAFGGIYIALRVLAGLLYFGLSSLIMQRCSRQWVAVFFAISRCFDAPMPPPSRFKTGIPLAQEAVILKALAKKPEDRFASCADFQSAWQWATALVATSIPLSPTVRSAARESDLTRTPTALAATPHPNSTLFAPTLAATAPKLTSLPVVNVSNNAANSSEPRLHVDAQGVVHVIWLDRGLRNQADVFYRRLAHGVWSDIQVLSRDVDARATDALNWLRKADGTWCAGFDAYGGKWYVSCLSANGWSTLEQFKSPMYYRLHALYGPNNELLFAGATTNAVYLNDQKLASTKGVPVDLKFFADTTGNFHILWVNAITSTFTIFHQYSLDGGRTWQAVQNVSPDDKSASHLSVAADPQGGLYAAWVAPSNELYVRHWTQLGGWGAPVQVTGGDVTSDVGLAVDAQGCVHLAAFAKSDFDNQLGMLYWQPDGTTKWKRPQVVRAMEKSTMPVSNVQLALGPDGGKHLLWQLGDNLRDIYYLSIP